jgi:hypothetical protein
MTVWFDDVFYVEAAPAPRRVSRRAPAPVRSA